MRKILIRRIIALGFNLIKKVFGGITYRLDMQSLVCSTALVGSIYDAQLG
jgi:hypothetical protein